MNGHHVERGSSTILSSFPHFLDHGTVMRLISKLESAHICRGYPRKEFVDMANARGGVIRRVNGEARAHVDSLHPVAMNGEIYQSTLRTTECSLLSQSPLCSQCRDYGPVLRSIYSQWIGKSRDHVNKFTNNRYLTLSQKDAKLKNLQDRVHQERKERIALEAKIEQLTSRSGVEVDPSLHQDLLSVMEGNNGKIAAEFPEGTFRRLFWEQQLKAAEKGPKQMRWHPTIIR